MTKNRVVAAFVIAAYAGCAVASTIEPTAAATRQPTVLDPSQMDGVSTGGEIIEMTPLGNIILNAEQLPDDLRGLVAMPSGSFWIVERNGNVEAWSNVSASGSSESQVTIIYRYNNGALMR